MTVGKPEETGVLVQNSAQNHPEIGQKASASKSLDSDAFQLEGWVIEETEAGVNITPSTSAGIGSGIENSADLDMVLGESELNQKPLQKDRSKTPVFNANFEGQKSTGFDRNSARDIRAESVSGSELGPEPEADVRAKSSLRMRYEAEVQLIKRKLGPLEFIRGQLGLTQRKMCQLLLVDPSAWTRWTREGEDAPPHIYRSLQWYLAIQDKYPALDVNFWLSTVTRAQEPQQNKERDQKINSVSSEVAALQAEIRRLRHEGQEESERLFRELTQARDQLARQGRRVLRVALVSSLFAAILAAVLVRLF